MVTVSENPVNNPAGRVLTFLRDFQRASDSGSSAMAGLMQLMDLPQESAEIYGAMAELRKQARSAQAQMEAFADIPGYRSYERFYDQVHDVTMRLQVAHQYSSKDVFVSMTDAGWSALEFADDVLSSQRPEPTLNNAEQNDYLARIRAVITAVASDDTLSVDDRSRLVDLLSKVEEALLKIRITGFLPAQEAAAAAGAIVQMNPNLLARIRTRPWLRDTLTTLAGIVIGLQGADSGIAVTEYVTKMLGS